VAALDRFNAREIGDGAADAQAAGVAAGGEAEFGGGHFGERFGIGG
jgi:hypothetical protein